MRYVRLRANMILQREWLLTRPRAYSLSGCAQSPSPRVSKARPRSQTLREKSEKRAAENVRDPNRLVIYANIAYRNRLSSYHESARASTSLDRYLPSSINYPPPREWLSSHVIIRTFSRRWVFVSIYLPRVSLRPSLCFSFSLLRVFLPREDASLRTSRK